METQTVVVTGASAGIGRPPPACSGSAAPRVGLIARGQAGLDGAVRDVEEAGGKALAVSADVADYGQVTRPPGRSRSTSGRSTSGSTSRSPRCSPVHRDHGGGVPAGDRGQLPRVRARDNGGAHADAAPRPGHDRAGRVGARASAASRCSRPTAAPSMRSTASPRRCAASCCTRLGRARDRGADAGRQHPAVLLGAVPAAEPSPAGAADLPARGRRPRRRVRRRPSPPAAVLGGGDHGGHLARQPAGPCPAGQVPGPYRLPRPADRAAGRAGPAGQPAAARRRARRARPRLARRLRRQVAPTAARSNGCPSTPACPLGSLRGPRSRGFPGGEAGTAAGDGCGGRRASAPDNPRRLWSGATPGSLG